MRALWFDLMPTSQNLSAKAVTSALGTKRQFARCKAMSVVEGKADLPVESPDFSVWVKGDILEGPVHVCFYEYTPPVGSRPSPE